MQLVLGALTTAAAIGLAKRHKTAKRRKSERWQRMLQSPQHNGRVFFNNLPTPMAAPGNGGNMLHAWLRGQEERIPESRLPVHTLRPGDLIRPPASGLRVTWLGHASALIEIDGARVLTDPVFSRRIGPTQLVGPKRFHDNPIALSEVPRLDAVVISHDHYDHLDRLTVIELARTGVPFIVPLGVGGRLAHWRIPETQIVELDWWQSHTIDGTTFVATPARHFSGRSLTDRNRTLWASFAIRGPEHRVYFGGDTGMFPGFTEIGEREGPFDVTLMPIGAYNDMWKAVHINPEEAVEAHLMVRGGLLVPIHWGTFNLAFHDWFEPAERLLAAGRMAEVEVAVPRAGRPLEPGQVPALEPWWREATGRVRAGRTDHTRIVQTPG